MNFYYQNDSKSFKYFEINEKENELEEFWIFEDDIFLRKFYENFAKNDKNPSSNSDDYLTYQSNFDDNSKNSEFSKQYENDSLDEASDKALDEALDETFDRNEYNSSVASQSAFRRRITSSSSFSDRIMKSSRDKASKSDYAKLHNSRKRTRNSTRNSDDKSITENVNYSWNFILNLHVYIIRVFRAFALKNTLKLTKHSKFQSLKEAKASSNWMHWKIAITVEIEHLIKADTYELVKSSLNRKVIIDRWVFQLKSDVHDNIVRYKARWVIHEYKQQKEIDFTVI